MFSHKRVDISTLLLLFTCLLKKLREFGREFVTILEVNFHKFYGLSTLETNNYTHVVVKNLKRVIDLWCTLETTKGFTWWYDNGRL